MYYINSVVYRRPRWSLVTRKMLCYVLVACAAILLSLYYIRSILKTYLFSLVSGAVIHPSKTDLIGFKYM